LNPALISRKQAGGVAGLHERELTDGKPPEAREQIKPAARECLSHRTGLATVVCGHRPGTASALSAAGGAVATTLSALRRMHKE